MKKTRKKKLVELNGEADHFIEMTVGLSNVSI